ncbi:5'-3' exonuclease [Buchnera aphidicola]|uniref:5'-3' exonuclease n=1 Tax=Buchnera aphidicola TaxID=9 RepID=UPI0031B89484
MNKKYTILIDGHSYLYRSYYALSHIKNKKNEYSGAIYGFIKMINLIIKNYNPKKILIIFDSKKKKNFRKKIFKKYKSNRKKMPKKLIQQFKKLCKILTYFRIQIIILPNTEADDIIGTITKKEKKKNKILIISNDKDFMQLVNKKIKIIRNFKKKPINIKKVIKIYGVKPKSIIDLFALIGDKADNIPGIKGIGKKKALFILKKFNSLNYIYKKKKKIKKLKCKKTIKIIKKIIKNKKKIKLFKKLIKIKKNIKFKIKIKKFKISNILIKKIKKIFKYYNFKTWVKQINNKTWLKKKINKIKKK